MSQRGKEWTQDELVLLGHMIRDKVPMRYIRTILGRSENAILHAIRNTMYYHLLDYDPEYIANRYRTTVENLSKDIVPAKYHVPLPTEVRDDTEEEASAESPYDEAAYRGWMALFLALCLAGMTYYAHVLGEGWTALTLPS